MNPSCSFAGNEWTSNSIEYRYYSQKVSPTTATHAQSLEADEGDEEYVPTERTNRNIVLNTERGTLVDYLDGFVERMKTFIYHRNLVAVEARSKLNFERVVCPFDFINDIDFSENRNIENFFKTQGEY